MELATAQDYMKFLDNPMILGVGNLPSYTRPSYSQREISQYMTFLNNVSVNHIQSKQVSTDIVPTNETSQSLAVISIKNDYLRMAQNEYPKIYEKDDGLKYILAFKKFDPLHLETIMTWGDEKLRKSADLTTEVTKLSTKYNLLSPSTILRDSLKAAQGQEGLMKKLFGKNSTESAKLKVGALKEQILPLLQECNILEKKIDDNFEDLMFVTSVLTVVNKVSQTREIKESDKLLFKTLHNRSMTLTEALTTSQILKPEITSLKENMVAVSGNIDDALMNTFRLIEFGKARDGNV